MTEQPFSPFGRDDPRTTAITEADEELLSGAPQPLKIMHPATITERVIESIRIEIATMTINPGDFLSIQMGRPYTPRQLQEIEEYVRSRVPEGVYVLILPEDAQMAVARKSLEPVDDDRPWKWED